MTPQEKYAAAFKKLLEIQKEVINSKDNPFTMNLPMYRGLQEESFISDDELDGLIEKVGNSASDNSNFSRLWHIGTDVVVNIKSLIK